MCQIKFSFWYFLFVCEDTVSTKLGCGGINKTFYLTVCSFYGHLANNLWPSRYHIMIILWTSYDYLAFKVGFSYDNLMIIFQSTLWSPYYRLIINLVTIILGLSYNHHLFISCSFFMQLGFNLSNGVTDTLESSSILIYFIQMKVIYTQVTLIKTMNLIQQNAKRALWLSQLNRFNLRRGESSNVSI